MFFPANTNQNTHHTCCQIHTLSHWHCFCSLTQPSLCSLQQLPNVASKSQPLTAKPVMGSSLIFFIFYHPLWVWWISTALAPRAKLPLHHQTTWTITQLLRRREYEREGTEDKKEENKEETSRCDRLHPLCTAAQQRVWFIHAFARGNRISPLANEP